MERYQTSIMAYEAAHLSDWLSGSKVKGQTGSLMFLRVPLRCMTHQV